MEDNDLEREKRVLQLMEQDRKDAERNERIHRWVLTSLVLLNAILVLLNVLFK